MRRSVMWRAGALFLALACVRLAFPPDVAASSGKIIYSFAGGADGAYPYSDLIVDAAGNLYGTTKQGGTVDGGTVFELTRTKDGWKHQVLYSFLGGPNDGAGPIAGLVFDSAGNLYGTTAGGGSSSSGTVFKLARNSHGDWTESILYSFTGSNGDGANPNTDLVLDSKGNLYGTTSGGGQYYKGECYSGCGIVFRLTPNSNGTWTETVIHVFAGTPDGGIPASAVALDADGNIYGTTAYGGTEQCWDYLFTGCGSLYKLTLDSGGGWTETLPYNFHRYQGTARNPSGGFLLEKAGRIFGTSTVGGDRNGAVFKLEQTKKGWEQIVLYRFYGNPDGENPIGRLAVGPNGKLYGATAGGGMNSYQYNGTVFELNQTQGGWRERVLLNANGFGYNPQAGPTVDSQGHVYGTFTDSSNGNSFGAVYEIVP
jgi:uncharacterized repeat protein (TIGR03803 family)